MLSVKFICVGRMREKFYIDAFAEYEKRLRSLCRFKLAELTEQRLGDNPSSAEISAALDREAQDILKAIPADAFVTAMCVEGRQMPSEGMAKLIAERENSGKPKLCFVIGGSFGLSDEVKSLGKMKLSFGKMTLPHQLMRVVLLEQVYRAFSISNNGKYHK